MTDTIIVNEVIETRVIAIAEQGPPGPTGGDIYLTADIALNAFKVVKASIGGCNYADNSSNTDMGLVLGITTAPALLNSIAEIRVSGVLTNPSWSFTKGPIYLGTNGEITQSIPLTGFIQQIGTAISATAVVVQIYQPINFLLAQLSSLGTLIKE